MSEWRKAEEAAKQRYREIMGHNYNPDGPIILKMMNGVPVSSLTLWLAILAQASSEHIPGFREAYKSISRDMERTLVYGEMHGDDEGAGSAQTR